MLPTRFPPGPSRHSSRTPCPTIPDAPNRTTFMSRRGGRHRHDQLEAVVLGGAGGRLHEQHGLAVRLLGALEPQLDALSLVLRVLLGQEAVEDVAHVAIDFLLDLLELLWAGAPGAALDH